MDTIGRDEGSGSISTLFSGYPVLYRLLVDGPRTYQGQIIVEGFIQNSVKWHDCMKAKEWNRIARTRPKAEKEFNCSANWVSLMLCYAAIIINASLCSHQKYSFMTLVIGLRQIGHPWARSNCDAHSKQAHTCPQLQKAQSSKRS